MSIVVIRFGYKEEGEPIGWNASRCRFCQAVQPMGVYTISRKNTISDVGIGKFTPYCRRLVCSFCNESLDIALNSPVQVSTTWHQGTDPLQSLVNETRPELGNVPDRHERSLSEVTAVLLRSDEWARHGFNHGGNRGCLAGVIGFVVLIGSCVAGYFISPASKPNAPPEAANYSLSFGLPFTLIVIVVSYLLWRYWGIRKLLASRLSEATRFHRIRKVQYQQAASRLKTCPKRILDAIGRVTEGGGITGGCE